MKSNKIPQQILNWLNNPDNDTNYLKNGRINVYDVKKMPTDLRDLYLFWAFENTKHLDIEVIEDNTIYEYTCDCGEDCKCVIQ